PGTAARSSSSCSARSGRGRSRSPSACWWRGANEARSPPSASASPYTGPLSRRPPPLPPPTLPSTGPSAAAATVWRWRPSTARRPSAGLPDLLEALFQAGEEELRVGDRSGVGVDADVEL